MNNTKSFRDPVHGYIEIPTDFCKDFIDTQLFQRLRSIEQTSMRCLYPAARHDRFIHSIGTYHIASKIFSTIEKTIDKTHDIKKIKNTFLLAALLHDCAHSPFSHTGEIFSQNYCFDIIKDSLLNLYSKEFARDLNSNKYSPATHELASAYIACKYFDQKLDRHNVDKEQMARMITGVLNNKDSKNKDVSIYNSLILLLNGFVIDADRLDYLLRDSWASGVSNANVDIERLIRGIEIIDSIPYIRIKNSSLSCLINAVKARDFIYQWIFCHHKVVYYNHVLESAIMELIEQLAQNAKKTLKEVGEALFSPERLLEKIELNKESA